MKHYVVMKEVHSLTPLHHVAVLALPPEKPQLLHTMGSSSLTLLCFAHILLLLT